MITKARCDERSPRRGIAKHQGLSPNPRALILDTAAATVKLRHYNMNGKSSHTMAELDYAPADLRGFTQL